MAGIGMLLILVVVCSMFASSKEERQAARERLARHSWKFAVATAAIWAVLFSSWHQ